MNNQIQASLNGKIQNLIQTFRETLPSELSALIEQGAEEISALPIANNALTVGDSAPNFKLKDYKNATHTLLDYLNHGPLVLFFYRGLWCPYCNLQLSVYNAHLQEIKALGANLVAISAESALGYQVVQESDMPVDAKNTVVEAPSFDVLHDEYANLAKRYGLVFTLPKSHQQLLSMMKVDIEKANGNDLYAFADPATYIIGTDGKIKWAFVPNNYRKRAEPTEIIQQIKNLL